MDTLKAVQIGGFTFLVFTIGAQVWKHPGTDDSHSHKENKSGPDQQIGRAAVEIAVTTGAMPPFVNAMDGNELRRYRPSASAYYHTQGEQQTPFAMRSL